MESNLQINKLKAEIARLKQLNSELQRNKSEFSYYAKFIDNVATGMVVCDLKGKFLLVNNFFCKFLGYSSKELLNMSFRDISYPDYLPNDIQKIKELLSNKLTTYTEEVQFLGKNKSLVWGKLTIILVKDNRDNPDVFIATINDVLDNVKLGEKPQISLTSTKLLNVVLDSIPDIIGIQDTKHNIIKYNEAGYKFLNKTYEEVKGKKCFFLIGRAKRCDVCSTADCYLSKKPERHEQFFPELGIWLDMRSYPVLDDNNNVILVIEHLRDITEQKTAKIKLEQAKEKWENVFNAIGQPALILDKNQKIIKANNKILELLENNGHKTKIKGKYCYDIFHVNVSCSPEGCPFKKMLISTKSETSAMPLEVLGGYYVISTTPVYNKQGELDYVIHIATDITELKDAEQKNIEHKNLLSQQNNEYLALNEELETINEELILAKEKAEESDKLKTSFLHNMSHEIRTPLNAIIGFSGLLCQEGINTEKQNTFSTIIENSGKQLLSIVNNILTISSLETAQENVNIEKVIVNNIIIELLSIFKSQAQKQNISLYTKIELTDNQSEIYTDKTKLIQILSNLISNALKFTHEGFIEFGYSYNNSELEFFCKDTGIGISKDIQTKIFERFRQANLLISREYGGTGLGLSISKAFVELLGGRIWVESELNKGSVFRFSIPYNPVNSNSEVKEIVQPKSDPTILVAEDEEYNFLYIEELLMDMDLTVIHARNGQEAVDVCNENSNIDLVLMDIKMPVMDGFEATKIIKKNNPTIIVVAQSAYALEDEIKQYSDMFDYYITKPINVNELKQKIIEFVGDRSIEK